MVMQRLLVVCGADSYSYWVGSLLCIEATLVGAHIPSYCGGMRLHPDACMSKQRYHLSINEVLHLCLPGCYGASLLSAACRVSVDMAQKSIDDSLPRLRLQIQHQL